MLLSKSQLNNEYMTGACGNLYFEYFVVIKGRGEI